MDVPEGVAPPSPDAVGSLHHDVGPPHPHVELVILQAPPPVLVAHAVDLLVGGPGDEQYAADEGRVVVLGVELVRGDVVGVGLRELVGEGGVLGEKIHVVHCYVVTVRVGLSEPDIDQIGAVEPREEVWSRDTHLLL